MYAEAVRCCRAALAAGAGLGCRDRPGGLGAVHLWKSPALDCATLSPRDRPRIGSMPVSDPRPRDLFLVRRWRHHLCSITRRPA